MVIKEITEKNIKLSKLVDERVYTISGELDKKQHDILDKSYKEKAHIASELYKSSKLNFKSIDLSKINNNAAENDIYNRIEKFEKKDARSTYNREYAPNVNAIVRRKNLALEMSAIDPLEYDLAMSTNKLKKILDLKQPTVAKVKINRQIINSSYDCNDTNQN